MTAARRAVISPESLRCRTVVPSTRCVSSRDIGWTSLLVELHTGWSSSEPYAAIATPDQKIGVAKAGRYVSDFFHGGRWRRGVYQPGSICMHRRGEVTRHRFETRESGDASSTVMVYLPHGQLSAAAEHLRRAGDRSAEPSLNPVVDRDPAISQMTSSLLRAMRQRADDLYAETAAAWLAVHLVTTHGRHAGVDDDRGGGGITDARLARVIEFMSTRFAEPLTLEDLAAEACISKYHFTRLFRSKVGRTPYGFLTDIRLETASRMLVTSDLSIAEVGVACGYPASSHFSAAFTAKYGATPTAFRVRRRSR